MSGPEPSWEQRPGAPNVFTRPLIGSELSFDQYMRLQDGTTQFAIGLQFSTTIHERDIKARVEEAVVRLRFECPLVGATIERGVHHPTFGSWIYAPLATPEAARAWARQTVHYLPDPVDPSSFLQTTVETHKLPYVLADGSEQYLRVYLTRPSVELNVFCLSLHAAHSVVDAKPALNALSLLLEWMATPETETEVGAIENLAWGTEHRNLPPGPVTVTGGPREDWSTNGVALVQKFREAFADPTPSHGLEFKADSGGGGIPPGRVPVHRFLVKFTTQESAKIAQSLKALGFTFSELLDAACVVATFEHNPVPPDKVETAHIKGGSPITLTDRLPAPLSRRTHLVSALVFASFRFDYAPLAAPPSTSTGRGARLLAAMRAVKRHYDAWLANPCLPHLLAVLAPHIAPTEEVSSAPPRPGGAYEPIMSNVGRVEDYVAPVWPKAKAKGGKEGEGGGGGGGGPVIRVEDMHMACRVGGAFFKPTLHCWSIQGRLSVLLQAAGVWDKDVLLEFVNGVVKQISLIIED